MKVREETDEVRATNVEILQKFATSRRRVQAVKEGRGEIEGGERPDLD